MMPVRLISLLDKTIDDDRRSPVADIVARSWDLPPGSARWWRSSACHVFLVPPAGYLRFVPDEVRAAESFAAIAALMAELSGRGLGVVAPVPSAYGRQTETVQTSLGTMHAMLLTAAPGEPIGVEDLTGQQAQAWGTALARLHATTLGTEPRGGLFAELSDLDDRTSAALLLAQLAEVPPDDVGLVHGDFELDNLAWSGGIPVAYDFDEATVSWFAADVAIAVRDIANRPNLLAEFLSGYRQIRPLDTTHLKLFARAQAACSIVRARRALAGAGDELPDLQARLRRHIERQRLIV
ncbi:MAG TPA: phosphotransferase [Candidatus Limnocylindrales bacterium]|nr:phosphotransferase [Candidatus Limnocylindrales bacterium]